MDIRDVAATLWHYLLERGYRLLPAPPRPASARIVSIGYEGRTSDEVAQVLKAHGVITLVDVRLTPISRKPGLSKTRLRSTLENEGIRYAHLRHLGNPKDNRAGFSSHDVSDAVARFRSLLMRPEAQLELEELGRLSVQGPIAILCYEREHTRCHRQVVIEQLRTYGRDYQVEAV
jgi:uncharacterized protein (DUF488 family)